LYADADGEFLLGLDRNGKVQTPEPLVSLESKPLLVVESPHLKNFRMIVNLFES
jgi:hypothetical protein